jgi:hypothetical protein
MQPDDQDVGHFSHHQAHKLCTCNLSKYLSKVHTCSASLTS